MSKQGYAIRRNGTCLSSETSCGITWDVWDPCCPGDTECADVNSNTQCNPANLAGPAFSQCSNPEWDLYQANGFFCCESGQTAFTSTESGTKGFYGCAEKDTFDNKVMRSLSPVQTATQSTSTTSTQSTESTSTTDTQSTSTTAPTTTASPTASPTSTATSEATHSSSNAGAIAGGVVGGVCAVALIAGLIWLLVRRRRFQKFTNDQTLKERKSPSELHSNDSHFETELPGKNWRVEAPGADVQRAELY